MEMDYFHEFIPLTRLARKCYLLDVAQMAETVRIANADRKDYMRELQRIRNDIKKLSGEDSAPDYSNSWARLHRVANGMR